MLFIRGRGVEAGLRDVASEVFGALGVSEWEERESANYPPDDHYFAGFFENAQLTVYDSDDDQSDYPFRVSVEDSVSRKGRGILSTEVASVAKALVARGFTVFVPAAGWERTDWDGEGEVYAP